ncbi:MAG TPA: alpha/beta hydrolase fold domain-containing protein [Roseiarcus sp.]|jgi:acetyl esterase/lipase/DNA-binding FadR family transcriptional regulator
MALLIERKAIGRADGIIASDLSDKMKAVAAEQRYVEDDGSYDLAQTRLWIDEYSALAGRDAGLSVVPTEDGAVATPAGRVATRLYNGAVDGPTIIFVHGGGWAIGGIHSHDPIAHWLAAEIGARVVQIEYALAPEHPYPVALTQVRAVVADILSNVRGPVFLAGDSAGANLAAMTIVELSRPERARIAGFVSIYGAYAPEMNLSSHRLYGDGRFGLSEAQMRWFWNLYAPQLTPEERAHKLSPLTADLEGFPPTLCIGTECDLLLDDTLAFYGELTKARVDVTLSLWSSLPHGCLHFVGVAPSVTEAASSIVQFVTARANQERIGEDGAGRRARAEGSRPLATGSNLAAERQDAPAAVAPALSALIDAEPFFTANRSRLHGSLAHRVAIDILRGELAPGSMLPREESANEAFGVSRSAYREAIRTLAAKGMVSASPKVGTKVAPRNVWHILDPDILAWSFESAPSETFIRNLFELRKIVEPSAAALAAMRRDDAELSRLADALSRMARTNPRSGPWLNAIVAFHQELMVAAHNEALASLWPAVQTTLRWSIKLQMMLVTLSLAHDPVADHARVFEKIASQNAQGTLTEMALLIDAALADTLLNMKRVEAARST